MELVPKPPELESPLCLPPQENSRQSRVCWQAIIAKNSVGQFESDKCSSIDIVIESMGYDGIPSAGQTPWLIGRPADSDSISDQWSKVQNIAIFRKKFRKDLNQNIDQSPDIWSKPSKDRNFLWKKKDLNLDLEFLRHLRNECRNFLGEGGNE
jgi:hypothetical protein